MPSTQRFSTTLATFMLVAGLACGDRDGGVCEVSQGWPLDIYAPPPGCGAGVTWWQGYLHVAHLLSACHHVKVIDASDFSQTVNGDLLELDGHASASTMSGYCKPALSGNAAFYVHVERAGSPAGGVPDGEYYLEWTATKFGLFGSQTRTSGYLRQFAGPSGPAGDLCFEGEYGSWYTSSFPLKWVHLTGAGSGTATQVGGVWQGVVE